MKHSTIGGDLVRDATAGVLTIVSQRQQRAFGGLFEAGCGSAGHGILGVAAEQLRIFRHTGQEIRRQVRAIVGAEQLQVGLRQRERAID